jgi:hypothetical protein
MTLHPWQRIVVAMASGIKLRGKMKYDCMIAHLSVRPDRRRPYVITVHADNPTLAAQEAASVVAGKQYADGQPGFVAPQSDGTFVACIGQQMPARADVGMIHHGFSITIHVAASYHDDACEPRACDHCSATYRGPAVYCSLECALADAHG